MLIYITAGDGPGHSRKTVSNPLPLRTSILHYHTHLQRVFNRILLNLL